MSRIRRRQPVAEVLGAAVVDGRRVVEVGVHVDELGLSRSALMLVGNPALAEVQQATEPEQEEPTPMPRRQQHTKAHRRKPAAEEAARLTSARAAIKRLLATVEGVPGAPRLFGPPGYRPVHWQWELVNNLIANGLVVAGDAGTKRTLLPRNPAALRALLDDPAALWHMTLDRRRSGQKPEPIERHLPDEMVGADDATEQLPAGGVEVPATLPVQGIAPPDRYQALMERVGTLEEKLDATMRGVAVLVEYAEEQRKLAEQVLALAQVLEQLK